MAIPLINPDLYGALCNIATERVRVVYPGVPLAGFYEVDPRAESGKPRKRLRIMARGEEYQTNCPFCGDKRLRLSINHRYGERDPETGFSNRELWKCYNQECQNSKARRDELYDMLTAPHVRRLVTGRGLGPIRNVDARTLEPCEFPGVLIPVDHLDLDHQVVNYLTGRNFDTLELTAMWRIAFADYVPPRTRGAMAQGRIIIPVTVDGIQVGWQARYPDDLDWKTAGVPKYLTYFPKSLAVYGLDAAESSPVLVLVEGVTDVWRYGPGGVSILGKKASERQVALLSAALRGRPLVIVPDMNDPESLDCFLDTAYKVVRAGHTGPVAIVTVPHGTDPADLDRPTFHNLVTAAVSDPMWPIRPV